MKTDDKDFEKLKWLRIFDPVHIPEYLVEQIKDRQFTVEKFYQFQKQSCIENINGQMVLNPFNLLYVLTDENTTVQGFCWMVVDPLCDALIINSFSMNDAYWNKGKCVGLLEAKAREIQQGADLKSVYWITRCPKHSEKYGFKKSKHILMEYVENGKNIPGEQSTSDRESAIDDSSTTAVPVFNT